MTVIFNALPSLSGQLTWLFAVALMPRLNHGCSRRISSWKAGLCQMLICAIALWGTLILVKLIFYTIYNSYNARTMLRLRRPYHLYSVPAYLATVSHYLYKDSQIAIVLLILWHSMLTLSNWYICSRELTHCIMSRPRMLRAQLDAPQSDNMHRRLPIQFFWFLIINTHTLCHDILDLQTGFVSSAGFGRPISSGWHMPIRGFTKWERRTRLKGISRATNVALNNCILL